MSEIASDWVAICRSEALAEGGEGCRFEHPIGSLVRPAFVVRVEGAPRAYLNRCAHVPVELDWFPGHFLDETGAQIVCTVHGALYRATDGHCIGGPCVGKRLESLPCEEREGLVWVKGAKPAGPALDSGTDAGQPQN